MSDRARLAAATAFSELQFVVTLSSNASSRLLIAA
jgi:hypothetical protein